MKKTPHIYYKNKEDNSSQTPLAHIGHKGNVEKEMGKTSHVFFFPGLFPSFWRITCADPSILHRTVVVCSLVNKAIRFRLTTASLRLHDKSTVFNKVKDD